MRLTCLILVLCSLFIISCESSSSNAEDQARSFSDDVSLAIARFKSRAPATQKFFDTAYAYAVFPNVGKGAIGIGAAHGSGQVFKDGKHIADSELSQVTVGLALGGQEFSEIIFFRDEMAFRSFKRSELEFSGQAGAVAVDAGPSADVNYENGVVVFTMTKGGAMFEASIGGQSFDYRPLH